jgi:hypothetical protein
VAWLHHNRDPRRLSCSQSISRKHQHFTFSFSETHGIIFVYTLFVGHKLADPFLCPVFLEILQALQKNWKKEL